MKTALIVFLVLGVYMAAALPGAPRVSGGAAVAPGAQSHVVALRRYNGRPGFFDHWAGGFLVTRRHVVTTASVFQPEFRTNPIFWRVRAGSVQRETGGSLVAVAGVVLHPDFDLASREADVAVVVLAAALADAVDAAPVSAPPQGFVVPAGVPCARTRTPNLRTELHGRLYFDALSEGHTVFAFHGRYEGDHAETLQTAVLTTIDNSLCTLLYADHATSSGIWSPTVSPRMLCATGAAATCEGDNGGPVALGGVAVGLISWGRSCAGLNLPNVFVDLSSFTNWLQATVQAT